MKIIHRILAALVALPIVAALASCSEKEAEDGAAAILAAQEVYIPTTANTTIALTADLFVRETYFEIHRVKAGAEVTVPLQVTCSSADDTVDKQVTFAEGSKVAKMVIKYDPLKLVEDKMETIAVTISDPKYTTPHGLSSVVLNIGLLSPWKPMYYGTWEFSLNAFDNDDHTPSYRKNLVLSSNRQDDSKFKITDLWGTGKDFYFTMKDNLVSFEDQETGADFGYGKLLISDLGKYDGYESYKGYRDGKTIYFGTYYLDDNWSWGYGFETFTLTESIQ